MYGETTHFFPRSRTYLTGLLSVVDSLQNIPSIFMTILIFLSLGSNITVILQSWKYSLKIKAFSFLYIHYVHSMCTIDFYFLLLPV